MVKKDKVFAGDLVLAKDTVCYLGDLARYKKETLETIKSALESGQIFIQSLENEEPLESYPLVSTIWTHSSIHGAKIKSSTGCASTAVAKVKAFFIEKSFYFIGTFTIVVHLFRSYFSKKINVKYEKIYLICML